MVRGGNVLRCLDKCRSLFQSRKVSHTVPKRRRIGSLSASSSSSTNSATSLHLETLPYKDEWQATTYVGALTSGGKARGAMRCHAIYHRHVVVVGYTCEDSNKTVYVVEDFWNNEWEDICQIYSGAVW